MILYNLFQGTVDITAGSSSASQPANGVVCSTSIVTHNDNEQLQTTIEYPSKHSPFNSSGNIFSGL